MRRLDEILAAARQLSEAERKRLIEELKAQPQVPSEERRRAALQRWRARSGTGHSDFTDVSSNKNKYLADIYATKP